MLNNCVMPGLDPGIQVRERIPAACNMIRLTMDVLRRDPV
jgi:hypothetical protein